MGRFKYTPEKDLEMQKDATVVRNEAVEKARKSMEINKPTPTNPPSPPEIEGKVEEAPRRGTVTRLPKQQQTRPDIERMQSVVEMKPKPATLIERDMPVHVPEKVNVPTPKHKRSVGEVIKDTATNLKLSVNDFRQRQEASKGG